MLEKSKSEFLIEDIFYAGKPGEPAGIYLLNGDWHLAAEDSVAQAMLLLNGALRIATLTFPARTKLAAAASN